MNLPAITISGLRIEIDGHVIIPDVNLNIPERQVTAIIGPNGCGKSTLLRALARVISPTTGTIHLAGTNTAGLGRKELSRRISLMAQGAVAPDGVTVADLVARGRFPHQGMFSQWSRQDEEMVARALDITRTTDLAGRRVVDLSGGQRQRVWLALVLAQDTPVMLLDEPTTYLDIGHQHQLLELVQELVRDQGRTMVTVLHDLQQAVRFADHLIVMKDGGVVAAGSPEAIVDAALISEVFGLEVEIIRAGSRQDLVVLPV
ncbi:ABC transporter ATP-binding protein [Corynebacterium sp. A21]|uniref:ABC transporter ATP-binding protein n=1 Tax=Corynebacterium sp. A21 TaxID=3457318 RepID=UPI003FD45C47